MSRRKKTPRSILYKEHLAKVYRLTDHAETLLLCWKVEELFEIRWDEEERKALIQAQKHLNDAENLVANVFSKRIGEMAVKEARGWV